MGSGVRGGGWGLALELQVVVGVERRGWGMGDAGSGGSCVFVVGSG